MCYKQVMVSWRTYSYRIREISIYTAMLDFEEFYQCYTKEKECYNAFYLSCISRVTTCLNVEGASWESREEKLVILTE